MIGLFKSLRQVFKKTTPPPLGGLALTQPMLAILHVSEESQREKSSRLHYPIRQMLLDQGHLASPERYLIINEWHGEYSLANYCVANAHLDNLHNGVLFLSNIFSINGYTHNIYDETLPLADKVIKQALEQNNFVFILTVSKLDEELDFYRKKYCRAKYREVSYFETMSHFNNAMLDSREAL